MPKKVDPNNYDYNRDTYVTESDQEIGRADLNKDGKVTPAEQKKYDKERTTVVSETTVGPGGETRTETTSPDFEEDKPNWSREAAARKGFTKEFLKRNPDVARLLQKAIEGNWTEEEFISLVETETKWGKRTTDAQAQFDLRYYGDKREDLQKEIVSNRDKVRNAAATLGVTLTEQEINSFAFRYTRAALTDQDLLDFLSSKYTMPGQATGTQPGQPGQPAVPTGTASELTDALRRMARSYGVTITPETLQTKVQEGLRQGERWQTWLEGQRNVFRQNAKTLYSSVADKLDDYTFEELLDPYLEDASALLGISRANMDITNPMWSKALTTMGGAPMTRDQWLTLLRTDKQYGWDKTNKAKTEYAELGDELLRVFGMA